MFPIDK